jgi:hypothetical protein
MSMAEHPRDRIGSGNATSRGGSIRATRHPGRAEHLDAVAGGGGAERLGRAVVERGDLADERLEARGRAEHEDAGGRVADAAGVRHAARREEELAGAERDLAARQIEGDLAVEDQEALVLGVVDVERRHVARRDLDHVDEPVAAAGARRVGDDAALRAEEVQVVGGAGRHGPTFGPRAYRRNRA